MYSFNYQKAKTLADAAKVLAKDGDAKLLAGGQSLIAAMKLRLAHPSEVIDLGTIKDLSGIKADGKAVGIGDRMVRNMGTIGGSLANNDPAADYPAAVLALGATVVTNKRKIAADEFFKGMYETALQKGEIITAVSFPVPKRAAYMKFKNPASRYAIVGVFVADFGTGVRVAVTGAAASVFRVAAMEKALAGRFAPESVADIKVPEKGLNSDLHAKADYRAHLITVMARRAVEAAMR